MHPDRIKRVELALCHWLFRNETSKTSYFGATDFKNKGGISRFSIYQLAESLKLDKQIDQKNEFDLRLRMALHMTPIEAINWDPKSFKSRPNVIKEYLSSEFNIPDIDADSLSRDVVSILQSYETRRKGGVSSEADDILKKQNNRCASCFVEITEANIVMEESKTTKEQDPYKPYFENPGVQYWLSPEVDHIVPVSTFGTNRRENLQVLCKLCNQGKYIDDGVTVFQEYEYASQQIENVCPQHRRRLLYFRLKMDKNGCTKCNSNLNELTVRKVRNKGGLLLSNLISVCYKCA